MGRVNDRVWESVEHPICLCIPCRLGSLQFKGQGYLRELEFSILALPHKGLMKKEAGGKCSCFSSLGCGSCSLLLSVSHQFCHSSKKGKILKLSSWSQGTAGVIQSLWALWLALVCYCFVTSTNIIVWFFWEGLCLYFWEGCICFFLTLMCIPWILYWIAGYREENHSECGCKDKRLQPGAAQTHRERWDTMDLWAGAVLEESCQRTGGSATWSGSDRVRKQRNSHGKAVLALFSSPAFCSS